MSETARRFVGSNGYVWFKDPGHPLAMANGRVYEHRAVAAEMLGRPLTKGEIVHHKNHDKTDNRPANLAVLSSRGHHKREHNRTGRYGRLAGESNPTIQCACGCGVELLRYDGYGRPRRYARGHSASRKPPRMGIDHTETAVCACGCGAIFDRWDEYRRERRFAWGHNVRRRHQGDQIDGK